MSGGRSSPAIPGLTPTTSTSIATDVFPSCRCCLLEAAREPDSGHDAALEDEVEDEYGNAAHPGARHLEAEVALLVAEGLGQLAQADRDRQRLAIGGGDEWPQVL